ncbi:ABC transporter substrate-binding protein [Xanthobacter sp. DSM 24535]|uniref:ABC transporter substrate-binding protein n=1 Tax=Roseixanthobacter psychrophilus TaxID=3119917 RepID=UPI00372C4714
MARKSVLPWVVGALGAALAVLPAQAEVAKVRIAQQLSLAFLPAMVMQKEKLLEAEMEKAGMRDVPVEWSTFAGGNSAIDAVLAGELQFASSGITPFITLWAKSNGRVKGVAAMSAQPEYLNCRNPALKSVRDLTIKDKIAVPAIKVSTQAVFLQMEAARTWGDANFEKLDPMTVSLSQADASIALMSGSGDIACTFTSQPFTFLQKKDPGIHTILNSFDTLGGPATLTMVWATVDFQKNNPKTYAAFLAAYEKALGIIRNDKKRAAQIYLDLSKDKSLSNADVVSIISDPQITFVMTPENTMKSVNFMNQVGRINKRPASWRDMWFENVHSLSGS